MTTLVLTVGGSTDPIVHAIIQNRADQVVFIASRDPERPNDDKVSSSAQIPAICARASIIQAATQTQDVAKPDDFLEVWQACETIAASTPRGDRVVANYTGGTKTMSAALAAFAVLHEWELQTQVARRNDLVRVTSSDRARIQQGVHVVRVQLALAQARAFEARGDYEAAVGVLESTPSAQSLDDEALQREIDQVAAENRFLDAFDRFDYESAAALLRGLGLGEKFGRSHGARLTECLQTLAWLREATTATPKRPFELVSALLENAQRAAGRGRYDDAFSRLYRASELTAQIALRHRHQLPTANPDPARLPPGFLRPDDGDPPKLFLGLIRSWELLEALGDPFGKYFSHKGARLMQLLPLRNNSWLAHGFAPVTAAIWREQGEAWLAWLRECFAVR